MTNMSQKKNISHSYSVIIT